MSVYSNTQITDAIQDGHIVCVPFNPKHVSHASLDVTLGHYYYRTERTDHHAIYNPFDGKDVARYFGEVKEAVTHREWCEANGFAPVEGIPLDHPIIPLQPGERILAHTHEFFGIVPPGACEVKSRSSWGRNGIAVCFDAGWIDPGYINRLTLEIYNLNQNETVLLPVGERIAQIIFHDTGEVQGNYGHGRDNEFSGKYQQGTDIDQLIATWEPHLMLPRAYKDSRHLPEVIPGLKAESDDLAGDHREKDQHKEQSMKDRNGTFIVIEGTDGSGKGTQFQLLSDRLTEAGYEVATFDFPQYDSPSSYFVREYLNGKYGTAEEVGPYTGSLFYALDRFEAANKIREALSEGKIVLANRFVGSNMAHQGTKFQHADERRGYFIWLDNLEFEMLRVPRPDVSFVLRVPAVIAQGLVDQKESRKYTDKKRDLHEADLSHLERAVSVYDEMCELFPRDFVRMDCVRNDQLLSIDDVQELLWQKISPLLPPPPQLEMSTPKIAAARTKKAKEATIVDDPYVRKNKAGDYEITEIGREFLENVVTNADENVYAFNGKLSPMTIAAAMARLSRRGDDMRVTLLDEFAGKLGKDQKLLQRVITAYGDDSVQQLAGIHVVVENASNILTKLLEWGRLAAYLEQSTRYIYFDQKDASGKYRYFTPDHFPDELKATYNTGMDKIFDIYSELVRKLTDYIQQSSSTPMDERDGPWRAATRAQACDAIRPLLPVSTTSTVGIFGSGQAIESLIMHLMSDELPEARHAGEQILKEVRKVMPTFFERADKPDRGGATVAYRANTRNAVAELAHKYLPGNLAAETAPVQLTDVWPRNEFDLVPDMLYEFSNLPLEKIREEVAAWPYTQKADVFEAYVGERLNRRHRPGRALEKAHYSWDLVCDYGIFRDLQRHRMVDDLEWQQLTPRYGYDVPELVEQAGLSDQFEACFDLSLQLYSKLQAAGFTAEAQYATLLGHRMRWKITYNARAAFHLHELRTSPQGHPGYRKLVQEMHAKLAEVHPMLGESMKFVNEGEDPELTRLAAERYTQFKLDQLDQQETASAVDK